MIKRVVFVPRGSVEKTSSGKKGRRIVRQRYLNGELERMEAHAADSPYRDYCRPKLADLLRALRLDREYVRAAGKWMTDSEGREVLDLIGGFGAAVLGHNPPELVAGMIADLQSEVPATPSARGARRRAGGATALALDGRCPGLPGELQQQWRRGRGGGDQARLQSPLRPGPAGVRAQTTLPCTTSTPRPTPSTVPGSCPEGKSLIDFRDDLDEYNLGQFELFQNQPVVVALKGSYHGKTTSALKATFNKSYREGFKGCRRFASCSSIRTPPCGSRRQSPTTSWRFLIPILDRGRVEIREVNMTRVFAMLLEVVLGEGGMRPWRREPGGPRCDGAVPGPPPGDR